MTLNNLEWSFCVKIWFELGIQWVGVLFSGEKLSGNLQNYAWTVSGKKCNPHCTGDISVIGLFTGVTQKEASNQ